MRRQIEVAVAAQADLGEGPWWDVGSAELWWVDILAALVHRWRPDDDHREIFGVGQPVGVVAKRLKGGLVCTVRDGIIFVGESGDGPTLVAEIEGDLQTNRMNDGKCDPQGRLWAGHNGLRSQRRSRLPLPGRI